MIGTDLVTTSLFTSGLTINLIIKKIIYLFIIIKLLYPFIFYFLSYSKYINILYNKEYFFSLLSDFGPVVWHYSYHILTM